MLKGGFCKGLYRGVLEGLLRGSMTKTYVRRTRSLDNGSLGGFQELDGGVLLVGAIVCWSLY